MTAPDFVLYVCWKCGHSIKWPKVHYAQPNRICQCSVPYTLMELVAGPLTEAADGAARPEGG